MRPQAILVALLLLVLIITVGCGSEHKAAQKIAEVEEELVDQPEVAPDDPNLEPEGPNEEPNEVEEEVEPAPKKCKRKRPRWRKKYRCKRLNKGKWIVCKRRKKYD